MSHEISPISSVIAELNTAQTKAAKEGAVWAVDQDGRKRPLIDAVYTLVGLYDLMHSGALGQIEPPITHDLQKPPEVTLPSPTLPDGQRSMWDIEQVQVNLEEISGKNGSQ